MISHHHRCIFVHIPKNAGQSIEHVFLNLLDLKWETRAPLLLRYNDRPELGPQRLAHLKADEYVRFKYLPQDMFDQYFKFTFVRNPWSRAVSLYKYLGYSKRLDFKSFLLGELKNKLINGKKRYVGLQSDYIYAEDGSLLVDFIGRFEDLQGGFNFVCKNLGIPLTRLPHVNKSPCNNKGSNSFFSSNPKKIARNLLRIHAMKRIPTFKNWREYYDRESIDCVSQIYKKDIELFKYEFD